jgi:UDP-N-acetyl-D-mannosaminuronate dehydrogenase
VRYHPSNVWKVLIALAGIRNNPWVSVAGARGRTDRALASEEVYVDKAEVVVVAGLGEVGKPLLELICKRHNGVGVDIAPWEGKLDSVGVLHICYPFQIVDFVGQTVDYINLFQPNLTIINSSVPVGTTRDVAIRSGTPLAHSPIRGKHAHMLDDLLKYEKFVGATDPITAERAARHFRSIGLRTRVLSGPETTELAKLTETTYFGLLIAWAQELERACDKLALDYDEVVAFYEEINFFPPVKYFPGIIGGHCVMPNIELLRGNVDLELVEAIRSSNSKKIRRESRRHNRESRTIASLRGTAITGRKAS